MHALLSMPIYAGSGYKSSGCIENTWYAGLTGNCVWRATWTRMSAVACMQRVC